MPRTNRFHLRNDFATPFVLNVEPEGVFVFLAPGEQVSVSEEFVTVPVTLKFGQGDGGEMIVSVCPGDGAVRVEKDGVDVLEMVQQGVEV